eukprot:TRINITY_DN7636_c0_g1_i1.p1 TRINITY_DN7636_c0_g1~~TRINITY_DN7636_c0_g1_i1.p1  ORF type:complete len:417 (-),score=93.46 TRINITY_DN7636_c0_g1_i1:48-1298(-)
MVKEDEMIDIGDIDMDKYPSEGKKYNKRKISVIIGIFVMLGLLIIGVFVAVIVSLSVLYAVEINQTSDSGTNNEYEGDSLGDILLSIENGEVTDWYTYNEDELLTMPLPDIFSQVIRNTTEYQVTLHNAKTWSSPKKFEENIKDLLTTINNVYNLGLTYENGVESLRIQYKLDTKGNYSCFNDRNVRIRDYTKGPKAGITTIDIKENSQNFTEAWLFPFFPNTDIFEDPYTLWTPTTVAEDSESSQKLEYDVHEDGSTKYSRESRIFIDSHPVYNEWTCRDLVLLYPWAFGELPDEYLDNHVKNRDEGEFNAFDPWYLIEHDIYFYYDDSDNLKTTSDVPSQEYIESSTRCEFATTVRYDTYNDADTHEKAPNYAEFSVRAYSTNNGLYNWDDNVLDILTNIQTAVGIWENEMSMK